MVHPLTVAADRAIAKLASGAAGASQGQNGDAGANGADGVDGARVMTELVPRLFRGRMHPTPAVRCAMVRLWNDVTVDSVTSEQVPQQVMIRRHLTGIMHDLVAGSSPALQSPKWRDRHAAVLALSEALTG